MDSNNEPSEVNGFMHFIKEWYGVIIAAGVVLFIVIVGGAQIPVVSTTLNDCKIIEKHKIFAKVYSYYVDTSCGRFSLDKNYFEQVEQGITYDLSTVSYPLFRPYITEIKVSTK